MRKYIQSISLYEDYSVTERNGQRIFVNPIPAFALETGKEHLSFVVVLSIINIPEGTLVKSSFEKLDEQLEKAVFSEENISDYLNIDGENKLASGKHSQMVFEVDADADGFGYYLVNVILELEGKELEKDAILVPIKEVGGVNE